MVDRHSLPGWIRRLLPLVVLWSSSAFAQTVEDARFTPLQVGNRWHYVYEFRGWFIGEQPREPPVFDGYLITEVKYDTLIGVEPHRVLLARHFDKNGVVTAAYSCAIKVLGDGSVSYASVDRIPGMCSREEPTLNDLPLPMADGGLNLNLRRDTVNVPATIPVGDTGYSFPITARHSSNTREYGHSFYYAADLGLYRIVHSLYPRSYGSWSSAGYTRTYRLVYAEVDGNVFGQALAVASEPLVVAGSVSLRVGPAYPNPAQGTAWFPVEAPEPGIFTLSVVDVRGRVVSSRRTAQGGVSSLAVDVEGLAAGIYLLRLTAPGGQRADRSFVVY